LDIRPTNAAPVIVAAGPDLYEVQLRNWGFIRHWPGKTGKLSKIVLINAMSESITKTRSFKQAFTERRCVIPLNAWFEWPEVPEINNGIKTKVRIFMPERPTFGAAGIYEDTIDKDTGEVTRFFSMLTVEPGQNSPIKSLHDRSPLVLPAHEYDVWLTGDTKQAKSLLHPYETPQAFEYEIIG